MNLLKETIAVLETNGKTPQDVVWCGSIDLQYVMTWQEYETLADVDYDSGYGAPEVATDLIIVGDGFYMERHEYDGSEWWEYKTLFPLSVTGITPNRLIVRNDQVGWVTLSSINNG